MNVFLFSKFKLIKFSKFIARLQNDLNLLSTNFILTLFAKATLACYPF
ncbi:hypothetical protein UNSW3_1463 [Campylobacter concisus UNSW3]|uniref:Uncharacterized protein n=1 Tax=Campylobacter concisus UNSW3 TaxID=1242966 RepID=U2FZQ4_9BACT|nr:hypothetical protein UNSW3_1463 [Campylobacter concisus UNSW3]